MHFHGERSSDEGSDGAVKSIQNLIYDFSVQNKIHIKDGGNFGI